MSKITKLFILLGIPLLCAVGVYSVMHLLFEKPADESNREERLVEIAPDKSFGEICSSLSEAGIVRSCLAFKILARLQGLDTAIKAGEYMMSPAMKPIQVLKKLELGDVFQRKVVIREGESIWSIGASVEKAGLVNRDVFDQSLVDKGLLARFGVNGDSFEGYLFPETYTFSRPIEASSIIFRMLEEGEKRWTTAYTDRADSMQLSRHEVLTLASIVEKESGNVEEQPIISSVFHNRLQQGMKLQSDPTVIYGIPNFDGNLTREHLETVTPYNTYTNFGLPPGPIGNPGESAIKATLYPSQTNYLFFVADGKGGHIFSSTLAEHNEAVRRYQIEPARRARAAAATQGNSVSASDVLVESVSEGAVAGVPAEVVVPASPITPQPQ